MMREVNAPARPCLRAFFCWWRGRPRTITAMTRALSALSIASRATSSPTVRRSDPDGSIERLSLPGPDPGIERLRLANGATHGLDTGRIKVDTRIDSGFG